MLGDRGGRTTAGRRQSGLARLLTAESESIPVPETLVLLKVAVGFARLRSGIGPPMITIIGKQPGHLLHSGTQGSPRGRVHSQSKHARSIDFASVFQNLSSDNEQVTLSCIGLLMFGCETESSRLAETVLHRLCL